MSIQPAQTLNAKRAEPGLDEARKSVAGRTGFPVSPEYSQDRRLDQLGLGIVGPYAERALERRERRTEFVTALLQRRLQHQDIGHRRFSVHPGREHGLRI